MMETFFLPISAEEYRRFLQGVNIGIRKHKSRPKDLLPLFMTEYEAISAYKRELNTLKSYSREFVVLRFKISSRHQNIIWSDSHPHWGSCLSRQFFVGATNYSQRRTLLDILWTLRYFRPKWNGGNENLIKEIT